MPNGRGYTVTYNGVPSTDIPSFICQKVKRRLLGKNRDVFREVAGREGAWRFGDKRGLKVITLECAIEADSFPAGRRAALNTIADWLDQGGFSPLIISDEPDVFHQAILANEPELDEWREMATFELEFSAEPYAYDLGQETLELTFTPGDDTETFSITDVVAAYPVVEVTPTGGNLSGFTLTTNGSQLVYGKALVDGSTTTISSLSYTVIEGTNLDTELTGAFNPSIVSMADVSGTFPILLPGVVNEMVLAMAEGSTATSVTVALTWRKRYR